MGKSVWKQSNKSHNHGRHKSKGALKALTAGRVEKHVSSTKKKIDTCKRVKKEQIKQKRELKLLQVSEMKKSVGKQGTSPHLVVIIPLHASVDCSKLKRDLLPEEAHHNTLGSSGSIFNYYKQKHRFQIVTPESDKLDIYLQYTSVADTVVFVVDMNENEPIDQQGLLALKTIQATGLSSQIFCGQNLFSNYPSTKKHQAVKSFVSKFVENHGNNSKFQVVDSQSDLDQLLRKICECKRKIIGMWEKRAFLLADNLQFEDNVLKVSGYVRNNSLNVNRLVHAVGWGNFRVKRIVKVHENCPYSAKEKANKMQNGAPGESYEEVSPDTRLQCSLDVEAEFDPMDADQPRITDEELKQAEEEYLYMKKQVPVGTSAYQSEWQLADGDEGRWQQTSDVEDMEEEDDDEEEEFEDSEEELDDEYKPQEMDAVTEADGKSVRFNLAAPSESMALDSDANRIDEDELQRFRDARSHENFPDEVDTPREKLARERFVNYRGLDSFRTSPWDKFENLPEDYAKIHNFDNKQHFNRIKKLVKNMECEKEHQVESGCYVTIELEGVDSHLFNVASSSNYPFTLFSLFQFEQKMSVLNFAIKKIVETEPIKSRDKHSKLVFHVGFRRFTASPVFSQHTSGNKHKMERYMPSSGVFVATCFAPVTFPPANVLVFRQGREQEGPICMGTLLSNDASRVIVKRTVLSGHPFKVNKKSCVVRYMFFNPEDIEYFKQVELRTKHGRRGNIKYPVGTHGLMKCYFNNSMSNQDTVLMSLYKRVFPLYDSYDQHTPQLVATQQELAMEE